MALKSDTWMAFYVGDYLADTMHLAREHHGSYLLMILAAFKNAGWLPNDDGLLAQIAKCTVKQWKTERAMYARFFVVCDERWTHKRVTIELEKADRLTEQRRAAGTASAAKRQRDGNDRSTSVEIPLQRNGRPSEPQSDVTTNLQVERGGASAPRTRGAQHGERLPEHWRPSADERSFAVDQGLDPDVTADTFRDYWHGVPGAKGRKVDWPGTWRNWCRRDRAGPVGTRPTRAAQPPRGNDAFYDELALIGDRSRRSAEPVGLLGSTDPVDPSIPDEAWHAPR